MPPKKPRKAPTEVKIEEEPVKETTIQAVILADSYNRRFEVLCSDQPRFLLPLCSYPLLDWTLESLSVSKVSQVFIFCGAHVDKIREYVAHTPYRFVMDIQCLYAQTARSSCDALREIDSMGVINPEHPFLLVHSPLISNYDFSKAIAEHERRKETIRDYVMTIGVGKGGRRHPESAVMLVHPQSQRLLQYIPRAYASSSSRIKIDAKFFNGDEYDSLETFEIWSGTSQEEDSKRGGYRDLGVDICGLDIAAMCTENFDWHDLRRNLVNGILTNEIEAKKMGVYLIGMDPPLAKMDPRAVESGKYCERVRDTRTFAEVSRDILRRWAFPLTPDNFGHGLSQYELRRDNVYVAKGVDLGSGTTVRGPSLFGETTALGAGARVDQSTIGKDCNVGHHTTLKRAYIFDDVRIGSQCHLEECIVGSGVRIGDKSTVGRGALIGDGVVIGSGVEVPPFSRLGSKRWRLEGWTEDDEEDDSDDEPPRPEFLTPDCQAFLWPMEEENDGSDSEDEMDDSFEDPRNKRLSQIGRSLSVGSSHEPSLSTLSGASEMEDDDESDLPTLAASLVLDDGPDPKFFSEAAESLDRAYEEGHSVANALLELKTLVMGYNAGLDRGREMVVKFFMGKCPSSGAAAHVLQASEKVWGRWGKMADGMSTDASNIILDIQTFCVDNEAYRPWFGIYLRAVYDTDVVTEDDLIEWRSLSTARGEGATEVKRPLWQEVYQKGKVYVDVLEQMESDDEDEEDEEDEDEEDD